MEVISISLWRRLLIIVYDSVLVFGMMYLALFPIVVIAPKLAENRLFTTGYSLFVAYLFFSWFWVKAGQTLAMKTWKTRVVSSNGSNISWKQATVRYLVAIVSWSALGLGFIWSVFDNKNRTWHDMASASLLVRSEE